MTGKIDGNFVYLDLDGEGKKITSNANLAFSIRLRTETDSRKGLLIYLAEGKFPNDKGWRYLDEVEFKSGKLRNMVYKWHDFLVAELKLMKCAKEAGIIDPFSTTPIEPFERGGVWYNLTAEETGASHYRMYFKGDNSDQMDGFDIAIRKIATANKSASLGDMEFFGLATYASFGKVEEGLDFCTRCFFEAFGRAPETLNLIYRFLADVGAPHAFHWAASEIAKKCRPNESEEGLIKKQFENSKAERVTALWANLPGKNKMNAEQMAGVLDEEIAKGLHDNVRLELFLTDLVNFHKNQSLIIKLSAENMAAIAAHFIFENGYYSSDDLFDGFKATLYDYPEVIGVTLKKAWPEDEHDRLLLIGRLYDPTTDKLTTAIKAAEG